MTINSHRTARKLSGGERRDIVPCYRALRPADGQAAAGPRPSVTSRTVQSELGKGSTFSFTLPPAPTEAARQVASTHHITSTGRVRKLALGLLDERSNGRVEPRPGQGPLKPLRQFRRREVADAVSSADGGGDAGVIDDAPQVLRHGRVGLRAAHLCETLERPE